MQYSSCFISRHCLLYSLLYMSIVCNPIYQHFLKRVKKCRLQRFITCTVIGNLKNPFGIAFKKLFQGKSWDVPEVSDVKVAYRVFRFPQFHYLTMCFYGLLCRNIFYKRDYISYYIYKYTNINTISTQLWLLTLQTHHKLHLSHGVCNPSLYGMIYIVLLQIQKE